MTDKKKKKKMKNLKSNIKITYWVKVCVWYVKKNVQCIFIINVRPFPPPPPRGGTRMARVGIRLVHGLTKSTLITYFSGMKIDPKYVFLHALIFLNLPVMFFIKFVYMTKNRPFFSNFACFCTPKRCTHVQYLVLKNNPNYVNFWTSLIPPLDIRVAPSGIFLLLLSSFKKTVVDCCLFVSTIFISPLILFTMSKNISSPRPPCNNLFWYMQSMKHFFFLVFFFLISTYFCKTIENQNCK